MEENRKHAKRPGINRAEMLLLAALIVIGIALFFVLRPLVQGGTKVVIRRDGEVFGTYELTDNAEVRIADGDDVNVLLIEDGRVRMTEANCPDLLCVKMPPLTEDYEGMIVCLPHGITVELSE